MRGKTVVQEASVLRVLGYLEIAAAGYATHRYIQTHSGLTLALGIISAIVGIGALIEHWFLNHPKIPDWAKDAFENKPPADILKSIPELRIVRTNPDGSKTDVTEDAIAGKVEGVNIGDKK